MRPSRDGADRSALHMERPYYTVPFRSFPVFDRVDGKLPASAGDCTSMTTFDHSPLMWNSNVETVKPPYFKLYRSWLHNEVIKNSIKDWWSNQPILGAESERLTKKLTGLRLYLISRRRQIREERTRIGPCPRSRQNRRQLVFDD